MADNASSAVAASQEKDNKSADQRIAREDTPSHAQLKSFSFWTSIMLGTVVPRANHSGAAGTAVGDREAGNRMVSAG